MRAGSAIGQIVHECHEANDIGLAAYRPLIELVQRAKLLTIVLAVAVLRSQFGSRVTP